MYFPYLAVLPADPDVGEDGGVHAEVFHNDGLQVFHLGDRLVVDLAPVPLHHVPHLLVRPLLHRGVLGKAAKVGLDLDLSWIYLELSVSFKI